MRRTSLMFVMLSLFAPAPAQAGGQGQAGEDKIDRLLARMTVAEKAGQMTQLNVSVIVDGEELPGSPFEINDEKLREIVVENGVGSLFGVWYGALSLERWRELVERIQALATEQTRLGIPVVFADDSVHGASYMLDATILPHNLNVAATWDLDLAERLGEVTAIETRAKGTHWTFAPVCDVGRQPMWSRHFETFGEDPLLAGEMAAAMTRGLQGDDLSGDRAVAATAKHFVGYSAPFTGRDRTPVYMGRTQLHDIHLPPFRAVIEAGIAAAMINSGEINGTPVHADPRILTGLLRDELGFRGVAVTDWGDINKLVDVHRVAPDRKEAARMAIEAGIDMSMVARSTDFTRNVIELVQEGRLSESTLDRSVRRILRLKSDLGLFDNPVGGDASVALVGSDAHHRASLEAARESLVLLRNRDGVLPIGEGARLLVTGPTADTLPPLYGAWTYSWQGTETRWYPETPTVLDAIRERFGADSVVYEPGATFDGTPEVERAASMAGEADAVVLCLGEPPSTERPGDLDDFGLDPAQLELARAVIDAGKPVVLVMISNRPRPFPAVEAGMDAVLWAGHPGPHGARAIAETLAGDDNPSGRLPFTYPRHPAHLVAYDRKWSENVQRDFSMGDADPLFEFGSGVGYAPFAYSGLEVSPRGGGLEVGVTVENAGTRAGEEVVQVYLSDLVASVTPHVRRLKAFEKIALEPGEARRVSFGLSRDDLSFIDRDGELVFEPGGFRVRVGDLEQTVAVE